MTYNEKLFMMSIRSKADIIIPKMINQIDDVFIIACQKYKGECHTCCIRQECVLYFNGNEPQFKSAIKHVQNLKMGDSDAEIIFE